MLQGGCSLCFSEAEPFVSSIWRLSREIGFIRQLESQTARREA
jgi:hypothetical protein